MTLRSAALAAALLLTTAARAQVPADTVALSLGDALGLAEVGSARTSIAGLRVTEAEARVQQARSALFPNLSAAVGFSERTTNSASLGFDFPTAPGAPPRSNLLGPVGVFDVRLRGSQPLYDPAIRARVAVARVAVTGGQAEREATAEDAIAQAGTAYVQAATAAARIDARRRDVVIARELLDVAQAQLDAGIAVGIDVIRARTQVAVAEGQLELARNARDQADLDVARALGLVPGLHFALTDSLTSSLGTSQAPAGVQAAVAAALAARPDLQAARARTDAAREAVRATRLESLPRVDVAADVGLNGPYNTVLGTNSVGIQLAVPLFDGHRRRARVAEQTAQVRESEIAAADLEAQIAADVQSALIGIASGQRQQALAQERLDLSAEELSQARERFANGIAGNTDVVNAQGSLNRARDAVIDAEAASALARLRLARAVGTVRTLG